MRETLIYALAMGFLAFGGSFSDAPLPVGAEAPCSMSCLTGEGSLQKVTNF